ncbi:MAG: CARDB domain-containing protein, partial [Patescibacteria group bacterium]
DLTGLALTVGNLTANTAYTFQVKAVAIDGTVLAVSNAVEVTTPVTPVPDVQPIDFQYYLAGNRVDVFVPLVSDGVAYRFYLDNVSHPVDGNTIVSFDLTFGDHLAWLEVGDFQNQLIAQSSRKTIRLGRVWVETIGSSIVDSNTAYQVVFRIHNDFAFSLSDWQYNIVDASDPLVVLASTRFASPGTILPNSVWEVVVPFTTGRIETNLSEISLVIYAEAKASDPNYRQRVTVYGQHYLTVKSYPDLTVSFGQAGLTAYASEPIRLPLTVSNSGRLTAPPCQLKLWLGGELIVEIAIPELAPGQNWTVDLPLGSLSQVGSYPLLALVDAADEVAELQEATYSVIQRQEVSPYYWASQPLADTEIFRSGYAGPWPCGYPLDAGAEQISLATRNGIYRVNRGLIKFPLPDLADDLVLVVSEAKLWLYCLNQSEYCSNQVFADRLTADWQTDEADWCNASFSQGWAEGGSFTNEAESRLVISQKGDGNGPYLEWFNWEVSGIVTSWFSGQPNYGFLLQQLDYSNEQTNQSLSFASNEYHDLVFRPYLEITGTLYRDQSVELPGNNVAETQLSIGQRPKPDLSIAGFQSTSPELYLGQLGDVTGTVVNSGNADSAPCQLAISFNGQTATLNLPAIPVGSSLPFSTTISFTAEGSQTVTATVDSSSLVNESNETNNSASTAVTVLLPLRPNTVTASVRSSPSPIYAGQTLTISFALVNTGQAIMPAQKVGFILGQNVCGTVDVPALAVSQSYNGQISFNSLATWQNQTLAFVVAADFTNVTTEENETDNVKTLPVSFLASGDNWDPVDDAVATATELASPTATEQSHGPHTLSSLDQADWFKVYLVKNHRYNFNTIGGTGDDYGELYSNSAGTVRVAFNDDSAGNYQFTFNYMPAVTGWYYLRVRAYSAGNNCSYSLQYRDLPAVNDAWDPADNAVTMATALGNPVATEQTHGPHTLSSIDQADWFKVYLTKDRRYSFNTIGGIGNDYGELYSNSTGTLRVASNDNSGGNLQFSLIYKPTVSGWYYLRVRASLAGDSCSYSLKYRDLGQ